mgnify:CR=1 FL=1
MNKNILLGAIVLIAIGLISWRLYDQWRERQIPLNPLYPEAYCQHLSNYSNDTGGELFRQECLRYVNADCQSNQDCGPFPCENNKCLIKRCNFDSDCPGLCGLNLTPVPGFCTTLDIK